MLANTVPIPKRPGHDDGSSSPMSPLPEDGDTAICRSPARTHLEPRACKTWPVTGRADSLIRVGSVRSQVSSVRLLILRYSNKSISGRDGGWTPRGLTPWRPGISSVLSRARAARSPGITSLSGRQLSILSSKRSLGSKGQIQTQVPSRATISHWIFAALSRRATPDVPKMGSGPVSH